MRLLLDSHVLLWWLRDDRRLGRRARELIARPANEVFVSAASIWEIAIKLSAGRLRWPDKGATTLESIVDVSRFHELAIAARHAASVRSLPPHHADPFDRLLVAQALLERLSVVTADPIIGRYAVSVVAADR